MTSVNYNFRPEKTKKCERMNKKLEIEDSRIDSWTLVTYNTSVVIMTIYVILSITLTHSHSHMA